MIIKMTTNPIKSFSIYGLFGTTDVHIPLDEPVKILVGENGLGKTQVLNLFYYTLTQKFSKLAEFYFDKLVLTFANGKIFEFKNNKNVLSHNPPFEKQK
jgi:predicted ATP-binding protein involved in virulence